jgi:hypothetical protein
VSEIGSFLASMPLMWLFHIANRRIILAGPQFGFRSNVDRLLAEGTEITLLIRDPRNRGHV